MPVQKNLFRRLEEKVDTFIKTNAHFRQACREVFDQLDYENVGTVKTSDAASAVDSLFDTLGEELKDYGIKVSKPTPEDVESFLKGSTIDQDGRLSLDAFEDLYTRVLKYAAVKFATGFTEKYGKGILGATLAFAVLKRSLKALPVVGPVMKPVLAFFPSVLVGTVVGVAAVYGMDKGDLFAAKKKLFPPRRGPISG